MQHPLETAGILTVTVQEESVERRRQLVKLKYSWFNYKYFLLLTFYIFAFYIFYYSLFKYKYRVI